MQFEARCASSQGLLENTCNCFHKRRKYSAGTTTKRRLSRMPCSSAPAVKQVQAGTQIASTFCSATFMRTVWIRARRAGSRCKAQSRATANITWKCSYAVQALSHIHDDDTEQTVSSRFFTENACFP